MSAITKKSQYLANTDVNPSTEMIRIPRRTRWGKSSTSNRELIDQVSTLLITTHILQNFPLIDGVLNSPSSGLAGNFPPAKSFKLPNLEVNSAGETQQTCPIGRCCHLGQHMVRLSIIPLLAGQWRSCTMVWCFQYLIITVVRTRILTVASRTASFSLLMTALSCQSLHS